MSKFQSPLINSKEAVLAKESGALKGQTGPCVGPWYLVGPIDKDK